MKKLFIFVSSLAMAPMIYSAINDEVTIEVNPVFMRPVKGETYGTFGSYTMPKEGEPFSLTVTLQTNTVQDLINAINQKVGTDGYSVSRLLSSEGRKDYADDPGVPLKHTNLLLEGWVTAIFEKK